MRFRYAHTPEKSPSISPTYSTTPSLPTTYNAHKSLIIIKLAPQKRILLSGAEERPKKTSKPKRRVGGSHTLSGRLRRLGDLPTEQMFGLNHLRNRGRHHRFPGPVPLL